MAHIDKEVVEEMVKKHFPKKYLNSPLFDRIVEVCLHAGYYEMDIDELCLSISNTLNEEYNRGLCKS